MKYTDENIQKLEKVYRIMMAASQLQDAAKKTALILKAGKLLHQVGLVSKTASVQQIAAAYSKHVLGRIREIVQKEQGQKSNEILH